MPWIILHGELRPAGRPDAERRPHDLLWATANAKGDRTAASVYNGQDTTCTAILQIRITFNREDFFPWSDILKHRPDFDRKLIPYYEKRAEKKGVRDFTQWYCRTTALPLDRIENVEAKTMRGPWFDVSPKVPVLFDDSEEDGVVMAIPIKNQVYVSKRLDDFGPGKVTGYMPRRIPLWEWNKETRELAGEAT